MKYMKLLIIALLLPAFKASAQSPSVDSLRIVYMDFSVIIEQPIGCDEVFDGPNIHSFRKLSVTDKKKCNKLYSLLRLNHLPLAVDRIIVLIKIFVYLNDHTKDTLCISESEQVQYKGQLFKNDKLITYTKKLIKSLDKDFTGSWEEAFKELFDKQKKTK